MIAALTIIAQILIGFILGWFACALMRAVNRGNEPMEYDPPRARSRIWDGFDPTEGEK